jgi:hypothetical protein
MKTTARITTTIEFTQTFTEAEARALDALVGYGFEPFLKVFYAHMGRHYMEPHEAGLRKLFESIGAVRAALSIIDDQRRTQVRALRSRSEP